MHRLLHIDGNVVAFSQAAKCYSALGRKSDANRFVEKKHKQKQYPLSFLVNVLERTLMRSTISPKKDGARNVENVFGCSSRRLVTTVSVFFFHTDMRSIFRWFCWHSFKKALYTNPRDRS